ncbi:MAG: hypothetical protein CL477_19720 [Acidobacteria bacterium]|jgi:hypothetical protein|nr:hypothetical protein [Acidobacteriota bacterium]MDP7480796.1 hypothetical protein [Vicinamibacterales bacterium]HJN43016.1 hypothetical protein [Vicinamibacterales bacterium]|tara:strand:+ start:309 stop:554 length:246 start_codon:yes stop_codon:yes gene_type:complete
MSLSQYVGGVIWLLVLWLLVGAWRLRRRRVTLGPGAAGMLDQFHDQDKRAAVQVIVEEKTGERDPEDRDGNLPDLENPRGR